MSGKQVIERSWSAPLSLVWELWTTPDGLESWWGPKGFTVEVREMDVQVGGAFSYVMRATDPAMIERMKAGGRPLEHAVEATYTEVRPKTRLAYTSPWGEEAMFTSVEFTEVDGGVEMVLVLDATRPEMTGGAAMGWKGSLERFAERLEA